jgi:enamine deaminase RidA (YjgF/YER057c/UK114 family)
MTTITRLNSGLRMSQAVIHNGTIYLAGQVGAPGECAANQTQAILAKIDALLEQSGSDKSHVLSATIWLADMADFEEMNAVWDNWIDREAPPARATGQSRLARPDYRVEIIVVAALK